MECGFSSTAAPLRSLFLRRGRQSTAKPRQYHFSTLEKPLDKRFFAYKVFLPRLAAEKQNASERRKISDFRFIDSLRPFLSVFQNVNRQQKCRLNARGKSKKEEPRLRVCVSRLSTGGRGWIRTIEAKSSRFTVCPLWPLGNSPVLS